MKISNFFRILKSSKFALAVGMLIVGSALSDLEAYADYCFFEKPAEWGTPTVWAWDDAQNNCCSNPTWPGDEMYLVDASANLYRWDSQADKHPTMLIISNRNDEKIRMYGVNSVKADGDTPFFNGATYKVDSSYSFGGGGGGGTAIESWEDDGTCVSVTCGVNVIYITPYSEDVVKVFTLPVGSTAQERRTITVSASPQVDYEVIDDDETALLIKIFNGTTVSIARSTGLISFIDKKGKEKLSEMSSLNNRGDSKTVKFAPMGDAAFYGGGYNGSNSNIKDMTVTLNNTQNWGWYLGGYPRCITIPFCVSTSGYGVLFDDHWRGAVMSPSSSGLQYTTYSQNPFAYYYIGGDNLDDVVANYTSLTGRQNLPPYWALGYITSRYSYWSETEAQGIISGIKNAGLPLDGIVFDLGWEGHNESGMGNLTWYRNKFPDPERMMSDWLDRGIHTIVITEPYFTSNCSNYTFPRNQGYFADDNVSNMTWLNSDKVGLLDATNPDALDWMWTFYRDRTREGMSGWWLDLGEPESHDDDSHHMGGSVSQVHNEFGQLWIERVYRGLREEFPEMRPFLMPRAGTSGMQRFSTFPWTGDISRSWGGLASQIPSLINMSMAGVSYIGSDVGGFADTGGGSPELYLRWVEFAALSPMLRTHSAQTPEPTDSRWASVFNDVKKFINLRYRLLPYTYTLSYLNTVNGWPMARPANAFDSDASVLGSSKDSYLWGKDIFVAPVVSDGTSRQITFPEGEWIDFNDFSRKYLGGSTINYNAPLNVLPYFMRRGSFIPMFTKTEGFGSTSEISYEDITVVHYATATPEEATDGLLFEDDRTSASSLDNNEFTLIRFHGEADENGNYLVSVEPETGSSTHFMPETRTIRMRLFGYAGVESPVLHTEAIAPEGPSLRAATNGGVVIEQKNSREEVDSHPNHAFYKSNDGEVYIKTVVPSTSKMHIAFGDISTGLEEMGINSGLMIEYVDGAINYLIPDGSYKSVIEFVTVDGRIIGSTSNLMADGYVHSIDIPEIEGFCIARLKSWTSDGVAEKTSKFMR